LDGLLTDLLVFPVCPQVFETAVSHGGGVSGSSHVVVGSAAFPKGKSYCYSVHIGAEWFVGGGLSLSLELGDCVVIKVVNDGWQGRGGSGEGLREALAPLLV
jgi:hypothetical protein